MPEEPVAIAKIVKPLGLQGKVALSVFGATLSGLDTPCEVLVGFSAGEAEPRELAGLEKNAKGFAGFIKGITDPETARTVQGKYLFLPAGRIPKLKDGSYYSYELNGMQVFLDDETCVLGTVTEVRKYPTVDALEVTRRDGSTVLLPFATDTVRVDTQRNCILVDRSTVEELL
jgi:16S rRNA processing protein RimM